jgi:hypothetical protein
MGRVRRIGLALTPEDLVPLALALCGLREPSPAGGHVVAAGLVGGAAGRRSLKSRPSVPDLIVSFARCLIALIGYDGSLVAIWRRHRPVHGFLTASPEGGAGIRVARHHGGAFVLSEWLRLSSFPQGAWTRLIRGWTG